MQTQKVIRKFGLGDCQHLLSSLLTAVSTLCPYFKYKLPTRTSESFAALKQCPQGKTDTCGQTVPLMAWVRNNFLLLVAPPRHHHRPAAALILLLLSRQCKFGIHPHSPNSLSPQTRKNSGSAGSSGVRGQRSTDRPPAVPPTSRSIPCWS